MTRSQIRAAIDRFLGTTSERMLREIQSSMIRRRVETATSKPMREFAAADFNVIGNIFRELRTAAAKTNGRR